MPAVRNAKSALSWRYPTRTPARVRITSTPTAGRATAASAASETATGGSGRAGGRNDRTPIGMAPLDAGGAIPGSDVVAPKVVRPSVATPVFLLLSGLPGRCCSVGSCGCVGGVTIAAGLSATGTWLHPGDAVDATAVRPFFLVSAATTLVTGAAAVGAGAAAVGADAAAVGAGAATLGAAAVGAGAATLGAAAVGAGAAAVGAGAAAVGAGASTFGTAFFGPFAPEGCWPGCGAEPSVPSSLSVPSGAFFGPFAGRLLAWLRGRAKRAVFAVRPARRFLRAFRAGGSLLA